MTLAKHALSGTFLIPPVLLDIKVLGLFSLDLPLSPRVR